MKTKAINIVSLALVIIATITMSALCVSCSSSPDQQKIITALATAGNAYIQASPEMSAEDKANAAIAFEIAKTGKPDKETLIAIAESKLGDKLPAEQRAAVLGLISLLQGGKLDQATLLDLGKKAATAYAQSQGIPPEQSAAALALLGLLTSAS